MSLFVWTVTAISFFFAFVSSFLLFVVDGPKAGSPLPALQWMFWGGWALTILGLEYEAKRDLYAVCIFTLFAGFLTAVICGAVAFLGSRPHPTVGAIGILGGIVMVASMGYVGWCQYGKDALPNILLQRFRRSHVWEVDGVQFASVHDGRRVEAGRSFDLVVTLQNCWDVERVVSFVLMAVRDKGLRSPRESAVALPAGAVVEARIPIGTEPGRKGRFALLLGVRAKGASGARIRRWRTQAHTFPESLASVILGSWRASRGRQDRRAVLASNPHGRRRRRRSPNRGSVASAAHAVLMTGLRRSVRI